MRAYTDLNSQQNLPHSHTSHTHTHVGSIQCHLAKVKPCNAMLLRWFLGEKGKEFAGNNNNNNNVSLLWYV